MSDQTFLYIGLVFLILAVIFIVSSIARKRTLGLPSGRIVYSDPGVTGKVEKPLYDSELGLTGKPDYVIDRRGEMIPVEIKSGWAPEKPFEGHVLQLASYCLLIERSTGKRPSHGLIKYRNRTFAIRYTNALRNRVIDLVQEIQYQKEQDELNRSHRHAARCERCGYRDLCEQRL